MLSKEEIKEILIPRLKEFETQRQAIHQYRTPKNIALFFMIGAIAIFIGVGISGVEESLQKMVKIFCGVVGVVSLIAFIALVFYIYNQEQKFEKKVKAQCYQPVFEAWKKGMVYKHNQCISKEVVKASGMIGEYNEHKGDDYGEGKLEDGRTFFFSELELNEVHRDSEGDESSRNVFKGLFFVLDGVQLYKEQGRIKVSSKRDIRDSFFKQLPPKTTKKSPLDMGILDADFVAPQQKKEAIALSKEQLQANFERLYRVDAEQINSSDFSANFMEQVNEIAELIVRPIRICFDQERVYAIFWSTPDFWKVSTAQPLYNEAQLEKQVADFQLNFEFMDRIIAATKTPATTA